MGALSSPPPGFVETFRFGGWRAIERDHHANTEYLVQWYRAAFGSCQAKGGN